MTEDNVMVELDGVTKQYGSLTAVDDLSISIREGEFFALLGPSGCGKTTTLRMIAGYETPTSGTVKIDGEEMGSTPPYNRETGMVFQGFALFPHKTVGENVGFGLKMEGVPEDERDEKVEEMLELVNLEGTKDRPPSELSGGQQQRVALARALAIEPSVLLLDEPLSNLDYKLRKELRFELKRIQRELEVTTVYVTHNQEEALSLSDRIVIMNDGADMQVGRPEEIYNWPKNRFVANFIGEANLFDGTITSVGEDAYEIELDPPLRQEISVPRTDNRFSPEAGRDDEIAINVRPENIEPVDSGGLVRGEVASKTYLGKSTRLLIDVDGMEVQAEVSNDLTEDQADYDIGDGIEFEWATETSVIIPEEQ